MEFDNLTKDLPLLLTGFKDDDVLVKGEKKVLGKAWGKSELLDEKNCSWEVLYAVSSLEIILSSGQE